MAYPISDVTRRIVYSGSAGVGPYSFGFEVLEQTDVVVYKNETLLTLTTDYTVTINVDGTGSVTLTSAATSADNITVAGDRAIERTTDFVTGGDLFANSLNDELDAQTIFAQQQQDEIDRSIKAPIYDPTDVDMTLPAKADRVNTLLQFDSDGNPDVIAVADFAAGLTGAILGANYVTTSATGNGSTTAFTVSSAPGDKGNIQIYIDGVYQNKDTFSIAGTTVTFTEAPPLNAAIEFVVGYSLGSTSGADAVTYTPAGTGAQTTTVQSKLRESVSVKDFGAVGDGVTDDTAAIQAAIDYAESIGGCGIYFPDGNYLAGSLVIDSTYINLFGSSEGTTITVKNSELGIWIKQHWCNITDLTIKSQGTKSDGLNTRGVLYEKAAANSIGFINNQNLTIDGFSGYGMQITEAINMYLNRAYVKNCTYGIYINRDGTGGADFTTTVDFENVYVTSCDTGIYGEYVYRSRFNVIAENCNYGMDMNVGAFTLDRCYFEGNITLGARIVNCIAQNLWTYSNNPATDAVSITFTGAVAAANRGYIEGAGDDWTAKRLGLLAQYGVDPLWFEPYGTTSNDGLKYGENTVALVRGTNLFDNAAWIGNNALTDDLDGWDNVNQGYKIAGTVSGSGVNDPYGMTQNVTLDNTKTYVIDLSVTNVQGSGISSIKVGADTVTNGVAFTPSASGSQAVKCFGADVATTVYECYVHSFTLAEVVADQTQVAEANDRLTREKIGRGVTYASAAPVSGAWLQGEIVYNSAPTSGGFVGWVCTASGKPGTWKTFGVIS